jgi:uncharacterized protein (TIGR02646 family)
VIKLERKECPPELMLRKEELTEEYKLSKKAVWKKRFITEPLLIMSNEKCCFCECKLVEEGKYMQVEHFHHKDEYEDEVLEWRNLLPICIRCNSHKRDHDTYTNEIIDPTIRNPQEDLYASRYRIKGKSELGKLTVEVLDLNDTEEIGVPRFKVASAVLEKMEGITQLVEDYNNLSSPAIDRARILRKIKSVLKECGPKYPYSAVVSSVILSNHEYDKIKTLLISKNLWSTELQNLEDIANSIRLDDQP